MTFKEIIQNKMNSDEETKRKQEEEIEKTMSIPVISETMLIDEEDIEEMKKNDIKEGMKKLQTIKSIIRKYEDILEETTNNLDELFDELYKQDDSLKEKREIIQKAFLPNNDIQLIRLTTIRNYKSDKVKEFIQSATKNEPEKIQEELFNIFENENNLKKRDTKIRELFETYYLKQIDFTCLEENFVTYFETREEEIVKQINDYMKEITKNDDDLFELYSKYTFTGLSDEDFINLNEEEMTEEIQRIETKKKLFKEIISEIAKSQNLKSSFILLQRLKLIFNLIPEEQLNSIKNKSQKEKTFKIQKYDKQLYMNDKISNSFSKFKNGELMIVDPKFKQKKLNELTVEAFFKNVEQKTSQIITPFDYIVLNKIYTITQEKNYFDINEIKKQMTQEETKNGMKKGKLDDEIKASIEKLSITKFSLKIAKEINQHFKFKLDEEILEEIGKETYLLPIEKEFYKKGGQMIECYVLITKPLYFQYATATGQIMSIESSFLQIPELSNTAEIVILKETLAKRIQNIIYNKFEEDKELSKINYKTLFIEQTEILKNIDPKSETFKSKYKRYREYTQIILNNYKQSKKIKDFKEYKSGGKTEGIQVIIFK